uniref:MAK10-like protein n=1 Tax=Tanacetum cinerariifolium TaxID=118510 RepID=A0A6L2JLH1_TANCI|nr:MAK10-like protein [Tanacetum cinerariifolium]
MIVVQWEWRDLPGGILSKGTWRTTDQAAGGKLRDKNDEESWALLEDLALYDNESWNDPRDFAKLVKAISMPHDVLSASDRYLLELKSQVQHAKTSRFEADFKQYQSEVTNKLDTFLKAFNDQITGVTPECAIQTCFKSNTCDKKDQLQVDTLTTSENETPTLKELKETLEYKFADLHLNRPVLEVLAHVLMDETLLDKYIVRLELGENRSEYIQSIELEEIKDLGLFILPCRLGDSKPFDTLDDLGSCVDLLLLKLFKELKVGLLEETDDVLGLADGTKSYTVWIVRNMEVHVGKLKLFEDFHVVDMEREPTCPLLVRRGFLATCRN